MSGVFDVSSFLKDYISDVKDAFPEFKSVIEANYVLETLDTAAECKFFEEMLRPHLMKIVNKDDSLFDSPIQILRGLEISSLWKDLSETTKDSIWKYIRMSLAFSFIGGDASEQIKSVIHLFKGFWTQQTGKDGDDIDSLLNDEKTQGNIADMLETFSNSKIAALVAEMVETIDPEKLGLDDFKIESMEQIMDLVKNPDNPIIRKATSMITNFLDEKIKKGSLRKEDLIAEIEMFKAKMTSSFGKLFKEAFVGPSNGPTQSAAVLMSSHPDARRARMLARLQKKQREKDTKK